MATLTLRSAKGSALTHAEVDGNFTALNDELPAFHAVHYGAVGDGVADDTAAIQAAVDAAYASTAGTLGGATVVFPPGRFNVTSVSRVFANARTVKIQGAGRLATVFQKTGATTTPVFDFTSGITLEGFPGPNSPVEGADFSDFTILGNAHAHPGIRLTLMARFTLNRVSIFDCSTGLDLVGSLIFACHDVVLTSNNVGLMTRKQPVAGFAGGGIYCNSWSFNGGTIQSNTSWGVDLGDADGVYFQGTNFERNGAVSNDNTTTGAVIIRDTVDDESVYVVINFNEIWFELNYCRMVQVEAAAGLALTFRDCHTDGNSDGNSTINVGAIRQFSLINFPMLWTQNAVISNATRTLIVGQDPYSYTDNSTTTRIGQAQAEIITNTRVVTAADNGKTFYLDDNATVGYTVTLPVPALGLRYRFSVYQVATTVGYLITTNGGANILTGTLQDVLGEMVTFASQDTITFVAGTALYTDSLEVHSDGVGWHCRAFSRVDGGITVSVT